MFVVLCMTLNLPEPVPLNYKMDTVTAEQCLARFTFSLWWLSALWNKIDPKL
jgi:hypothetical protein